MRARAGRPPRRVVFDARAKLNLGLAVGPRRPDGYHELATVFQSISLADTLTAERTARGFSLAIRYEDASLRGPQTRRTRAVIPAGRANLVLRAARLAAKRFGLTGGARFRLIKRIPARAGLGGGSMDAGAAFAAMLALHGVRPPLADRLAAALELGSDVPFALFGGTALGFGRGERLRRLRLERPIRAVVAVPAWRISTAKAFAEIDRIKYSLTEWGRYLRFAKSLGRERVSALRALRLGNSFEAVLEQHQVEFLSLCARLRAAGLEHPHLTGSGSGVFGIVPDGTPVARIAGRFDGGEPLYAVRTVGTCLRIRQQL